MADAASGSPPPGIGYVFTVDNLLKMLSITLRLQVMMAVALRAIHMVLHSDNHLLPGW